MVVYEVVLVWLTSNDLKASSFQRVTYVIIIFMREGATCHVVNLWLVGTFEQVDVARGGGSV